MDGMRARGTFWRARMKVKKGRDEGERVEAFST